MRQLATAIAAIGLAAIGLAAPAHAAPQGTGCSSKWPGRDGYVRAWQHYDCGGSLLGSSTGNDADWGDRAGGFTVFAADEASAVLNSAFTGGRDVVAFYARPGFYGAYVCLSPQELYADNLTDNFYAGSSLVVNDNIESHAW